MCILGKSAKHVSTMGTAKAYGILRGNTTPLLHIVADTATIYKKIRIWE